VVHCDQVTTLHAYENMEPRIYWGSWRNVMGHVTIWLTWNAGQCKWHSTDGCACVFATCDL